MPVVSSAYMRAAFKERAHAMYNSHKVEVDKSSKSSDVLTHVDDLNIFKGHLYDIFFMYHKIVTVIEIYLISQFSSVIPLILVLSLNIGFPVSICQTLLFFEILFTILPNATMITKPLKIQIW
jgi:hypothetical protein